MARNESIAIDITAKDKASGVIDKLAKRIEGMEADEARITVSAQTDKLERQLERAKTKLEGLEGDELTVQARLVGTIEADLEQAQALFKELDGKTGTITLDVDADTAQLDTIKGKVDEVESSGKASGVAIGGIGNAVSELPGAEALGPLAESLGQMAETALEGGENVAAMGAAMGVLAGAAVVMAGVNDIMKSMADGQLATKAFDEDQVKIFNQAIEDGGRVADNYKTALKDLGEVLAVTGTNAGPAWTNILPGVNTVVDVLGVMGKFGDKIEDIVPLLDKAGVSAGIWTETITSKDPKQAMDDLRGALDLTNISDDERHSILIAAKGAQDDYNTSVENGTKVTGFFGDETDNLYDSHQRTKDAVDDNRAALDRHKQELIKAKDATDDLRAANEKLRGDLDKREAYLNLQGTFADLRTAGDEAMEAVATGAVDAETATRNFELQQIAAKNEVLDYIDTIEGIPPEKESQILTLIDQGKYDEALAMVEDLVKPQTVDVRFNVIRPKSIGVGSAGGGGIPIGLTQQSTATLTAGTAPVATATVPEVVVPVRLKLPTSAQIARQIGPLNLAVASGLRANERLTGIRD